METRNSDRPLLPPWALRVMAFGALAVLVGAATPPGAAAAAEVQRFLAFYAGVFSLIAMSAAVVSGLIATERMILRIGHRVLAQAVHRASALVGFTFLVSHFLVKVLGGQAAPAQIVVPYAGPVGLGAIAFDLFLIVVITGLLRPRFASAARPWMWRMFHVTAYVAWPVAITHGLTAGRPAANWVVLSYLLCVLGVAMAAFTRLLVTVKPRSVPRGAPDTMPAATVAGQRTTSGQRQEALR
ncbi:hypothetical protein SAMN04489712_101102 [Thermomonospora echinospora]|uniref:DMSO/TMAO reductase YedYZ, heme-binding membrane subunit n=1 Tax=Thermomonospora echinospora TaxID=1992 RepID=A0A1H5S726_9ACTN|nr:hypothetical protein [Thermomonospora echinospora]SEF46389.1 hypothetical protein SAMN04489712_101102 [Thermomonospora echinospora]